MTTDNKQISGLPVTRKRLVVTVLGSAAATVLLALLAGVAFIYSGIYDVSATRGHTSIVRWALGTLAARSIEAHAGSATIPGGADAVRDGAAHYDRMCAGCHGAPGLQRNWLGKGIQPQAPDLAETAGQRTRAEIYQALKYGIRFTGMPALAPTHSDEEIGEITAFVLALANMSPEQYQRLRASETHEDSSEKPGIQAHDDEHLHHH